MIGSSDTATGTSIAHEGTQDQQPPIQHLPDRFPPEERSLVFDEAAPARGGLFDMQTEVELGGDAGHLLRTKTQIGRRKTLDFAPEKKEQHAEQRVLAERTIGTHRLDDGFERGLLVGEAIRSTSSMHADEELAEARVRPLMLRRSTIRLAKNPTISSSSPC